MAALRFRKRPVEIEAWRYAEGPKGNGAIEPIPPWMREARDDKRVWIDPQDSTMKIATLEGVMTAQRGDWIIRGVAGELYPCKPDIFEQSYELVAEDEE